MHKLVHGMVLSDLRGWLPVDAVVVNGRPGLAWMDMKGVKLAEPFFQQTVDKLKAEAPTREVRFTEFDALIQLEKTFDSVPPSGFIFHSSRCGSTLLANACRALDGAIVLSEPPAVDKLIARFITDVGDQRTKETLYSIFLRAVVTALGQKRFADERHLFVKFACCSVSQIERVRGIWPNVPWVFLYRDPVETIVSNMQNLPAWLQDEDHRVLASITGTSPNEVASMSAEELCARAIGSFFSTAGSALIRSAGGSPAIGDMRCATPELRASRPRSELRHYSTAHRVANDRALLLNYSQLTLTEIANVLEFFGVKPAATEMEIIARQTQKYSKAASGERAFVADTEAKRQAASDLVRAMAERWANSSYQLLEQYRQGNQSS